MNIYLKAFLAVFILIAIFLFIRDVMMRTIIVLKGKKLNRFDKPLNRLFNVLRKVFTQWNVIRHRSLTGIFHSFIFWAFFLFLITTIDSLLFLYSGFSFLRKGGGFWTVCRFFIDIIAILALFGSVGLGIRRFLIRPEGIIKPNPENKVLVHKKAEKSPQLESFVLLLLIFYLMLSYIIEESIGIRLRELNPDGRWLAISISPLLPSSHSLMIFFQFTHIASVFLFLILIPRSKHLHIFTGFINVFFSRREPYGVLSPIDFEKEETWGANEVEHLTWKEIFDSFACIECGRCQDECPAYIAGSSLSPKYLIINLREIALKGGEKLSEGVLTDEALWACTTCAACMEVCPMDIEHIPIIMDIRKSEVLNESKFPREITPALKGLETQKNPWNLWADEREKWFNGLDVPLARENKDFDILYWAGCATTFDERAQQIARAVVSILKRANVNFAILGKEEICTGDPARRMGQEYLFQTIAQETISLLKEHNVKKILCSCPHCYNVFKNEYPVLGFETEVWHHSEYIYKLVTEKNIKIEKNGSFVFHDPCYLGRYNQIYNEPRNILKLTGELIETPRSRERSYCCGAGGARMWMETKQGEKVNMVRTKELLQTKAKTGVVACPFCIRMIEDGLKEIGDESFSLKDIAEVVSERMG